MAAVRTGINLRGAISAQQLRQLYVTRGLTIAQVAGQLGVASTTISRRLRELAISERPRGARPTTSSTPDTAVWTADLAYFVGLIATDGNLSKKPGRIAIMSNDTDLLQLVRERLRLVAEIRPHRGGYGMRCHHLIWSDRRLYDWLISIGLTPAKSLTLTPLAIPDDYFADFFRGCIDGDGSIVSYVDRLRLHAPLCLGRVGQYSLHRVAPRERSAARERGRSCRREPTKRSSPSMAAAICQARFRGGAAVDLLCAGGGLSGSKATHRRAVSHRRREAGGAEARPAGGSMSRQSRRVETGKRYRLKTGCP